MMKYFFTIFLFFTIFTNLSAQNFADKEYYLIDSLVLEDLSEFDNILLEKHLKEYHTINSFHKLDHLDSIIKLASSEFLWRAFNKPYWNESEKFSQQFKEGTEEWREVIKHKANAINNNAEIFDYAEQLDSAVLYYKIALELYKKIELNQSIGELMNMISVIYREMDGKYFEAIEMANESLKYLDTNQINTAICFSNYAGFQMQQYNYEEALFYKNKALAIAVKFNQKKEIIGELADIATINRRQGSLDEADSIIRYTIPIMNSIENLRPFESLRIKYVFAQILLGQEKLDTAQIVFEEILEQAEENGFNYLFVSANSSLAKIAIMKGNYAKSKPYANLANKLAQEYEMQDLIGWNLKK